MRISKIPGGSGLLLITTVLWISGGCKKARPPQATIDAFFHAARTCDKARMRACFTSRLLKNMDKVFKAGSEIVGNNLRIDLLDGLCKAYKNVNWNAEPADITGKTARLKVRVNEQDLTFLLRLDRDKWRIYSVASPVYRIDEHGLHETGR